ncbi:MAG: UvrD-helicase domain-containing protein [Defluviitaleaceae bacterium]|nr:UvrD-helicase domain-containing protein [Defluviitaleaceae bacterium]
MIDLSKLNPMQRKAVEHTEGPLLLLAGAGSGKTNALTYRIAYLIDNGVSPFNILAITFTNKAAREMRDRVCNLSPKGDQVWVSTFHSTCVRILRREISHLNRGNNFTIFDADDSERLVKACIAELNINEKQFPPKGVLYTISAQKNELIGPENFAQANAGDFRLAKTAQVYKLYQKKLLEANALDFDDIIFKTVELFAKCPDVLERYQDRFHYILVDEYQDTNTSQYRLVRILAAKYQNLCVVGDDDQSIYGWRGANIRNILDFEKDFPKAAVIKLEQNYRSTKNILDAANSVISNNKGRKAKKLWTENTAGSKIYYQKVGSDKDEGMFVADTIRKKAAQGARYSDFAVLYRNNAQSRSIEDQLVFQSIPYRLFGGVRFYERKEVKDILAYLKVIYNQADIVSLSRIINVPRRGIGNASVDRLIAQAGADGVTLFETLKQADKAGLTGARLVRIKEFADLMERLIEYAQGHLITDVIKRVIAETNYTADLLLEGTEEAIGRVENVNELLSKAAEFEAGRENADLSAFLEDVALVADVDNYTEGEDTAVLMTLHSSKGLEFPCVFLVGVEEGLFPSYRAVMSDSPKELEEERRLCYVGITRAMRELYITSATSRMQYGQVVYNAPSRFIGEIGKEYINR